MLRKDLFGQVERNEANALTALSHDPAFAGTICFDEFRQSVMAIRPLPWSPGGASFPRPWADVDDIKTAEWLQRLGINVGPHLVARVIQVISAENKIHPVRDYLNSLQWDGVSRIGTWLIDYLGAADTELNRAFGSMWMISAVARIMRPGTKADHCGSASANDPAPAGQQHTHICRGRANPAPQISAITGPNEPNTSRKAGSVLDADWGSTLRAV